MMKKEDGVTLVALVITIIVMLILVGISLGLIVDSDSVFARAIEAKEKWNNDVDYENNVMVKQVTDVLYYDI